MAYIHRLFAVLAINGFNVQCNVSSISLRRQRLVSMVDDIMAMANGSGVARHGGQATRHFGGNSGKGRKEGSRGVCRWWWWLKEMGHKVE